MLLDLFLFQAPLATNQTVMADLLKPTIETVQVEEKPKELTIEEKIEANYYGCDTDTEWIRADNAKCITKTTPNTQKAVRAAVGGYNGYVRGQCTWYAKNYVGWVPNGWGNASRWDDNARRQGYTVSNTPVVGAIAQHDRGWYGHVAVVTAVNGDRVTITEMNYNGPYKKNTRTVHKSFFRYIY